MLIDMADIRELLDIPANSNARFEMLLKATWSMFQRNTDRVWERVEDYVVKFTPEAYSRYLWSPVYPLESVAMMEWGSFELETSAIAVPVADFHYVPATGEILRARSTSWLSNVKAIVTGGHTKETLPGDILPAIVTQIRFSAARNAVGNVVLSGQNFEGGSGQFLKPGYHPDFLDICKAYRRRA